MTKVISRVAAAAVLAIASTSAAQAEDGIYYGVGLGFGAMESLVFRTSEANLPLITGTMGYRIDAGTLFYGGELDVDLGLGGEFESAGVTCDVVASAPYFCSHSATVRLRGIVGSQTGNTEIFGTAGLAMVFGTSAVSPSAQGEAKTTGFTLGLGVQQPMMGGTGRLEFIYDKVTDGSVVGAPPSFYPEFEAMTLKATFLF